MFFGNLKRYKTKNMKMSPTQLILVVLMSMSLASCWEITPPTITGFTLRDEVNLGQQIHEAWLSVPDSITILDPAEHQEVYNYISGLRAFILSTRMLENQDAFTWDIFVIQDDTKTDMFTTAGGYIYVHTGLLKYLTNENQLLNLLAHEMAYADKRYNKDFLQTNYNFSILLDVSQGGNAELTHDIATDLLNAKYEKAMVMAADSFTVQAICPTPYDAAGLADFLLQAGNEPLDWILRHNNMTDPMTRINNITTHKSDLGCTGNFVRASNYQAFIKKLP